MTDLEKLELRYPVGCSELYDYKSEIPPIGAWFIIGVESCELLFSDIYRTIDVWERFI